MAASIALERLAASPVPAATPARQPSPLWDGLRLGLERGAQFVIALIGGLGMTEFGSGLGWLADFVIGFLLIGLLYSGLNALVALLWKLVGLLAKGIGAVLARRSPAAAGKCLAPYHFLRRIRGQSIGAVLAPIAIMMMDKVKIGGASLVSLPSVTESLIPFGILASALLGLALAHGLERGQRIALAAAAAVVVALPLGWYLWPGTTGYLAQPSAGALSALPEFTFENPGLPGPYQVQSLTYGSGQARRAEFGKSADLITPTVDPTAAYAGWTGLAGSFFQWLFGFDFKHLPLAAEVWYPAGITGAGSAAGDGPFPLVLIVHGNHQASEYSDPGYAYLGEHFASHGFITASVDENFLNGHALWDGQGSEMPVRAWLLLKHLQVWRDWNATSGNPFYGKVDLDRVVLMGHSRGGEAVAHAAMLNTKLTSPLNKLSDDGDFNFGIRGVVAIGPADGQWKPYAAERKVVDVSYLLIQGGHDQDLSSLSGIRQYNRVRFESNPEAFKAVAYIYRANHGNFNTVWGDADHGVSASMILNRAPLLTGEEQRTAAKVFMTAFLEATLADRPEYRKVFVSPAGARAWLPQDVYATQYEDATFQAIDTFDPLSKAEAADATEPKSEHSGLVNLGEPALSLRDAQLQENRALRVEWTAGSNPTYSLTLPQGADASFKLDGDERLAFELSNAGDEATPVYVTVELVDAHGAVAALAANRYGVLPPPMPARLEKSRQVSKLLGYDFFPRVSTPYERVLQSFEIPLPAFTAANLEFDSSQIRMIRFRFNDENPGKVYLDEIGFRG